jgi:hypothetical protein
MTRQTFLPTARQLNVVLTVGFLALGYALYLRYLVIEQAGVGLACVAGLSTWVCFIRKIVIVVFLQNIFGAVALGAALLHLLRPSLVLLLIALAAAAFGIVLYNTGFSALAVALLILALARPQSAQA